MGRFHHKPIFRQLFLDAEKRIGKHSNSLSGMPETARSVLECLNVNKIIEAKNKNLLMAESMIDDAGILPFKGRMAFGLFLKSDSFHESDLLKSYLVEKNIYPAILWPGQFTQRNIEAGSKYLFIHVDYRYDSTDIKYISSVINKFSRNEPVFRNTKERS